MNYVLFFGSFLLAVASVWMPTPSHQSRAPAYIYRIAVLLSGGVTSGLWYWLYTHHWVPSYAVLAAVAGAVIGGLATTGIDLGFVEYAARPSVDVRDKVRSQHSVFMRYRCRSILKWAFDSIAALTVIVVTLPAWPVIALLVWFEEPGPIFHIEHSVGKRGITFRRLTFRTTSYGAGWLTEAVNPSTGQPRSLTVGRFLRRWHLDELPELINVLVGSMSLVGPRPLPTVLVRQHLDEVPGYAERHTVKPGIACLAQTDSHHMTPAQRLAGDREYIRRMSFPLDLVLLGRAVVATLRAERRRGPATGVPRQPSRPPGERRGVRLVRPGRRSRAGQHGPRSMTSTSVPPSNVLRTSRPD